MAWTPATERKELHHRAIDLRGYRRSDGLFDIEASLIDRKAEDTRNQLGRCIPGGATFHHMLLRLVVDADLQIVDVVACTVAAPYVQCPEATRGLQRIQGLRIGRGWNRAVRERLAGAPGCTHLTELLAPLATVAWQTLGSERQAKGAPPAMKIDSCHAYAREGPLVQQLQRLAAGADSPSVSPH